MQRADINGVQLEYEVSGAGDPIIFIHGAFVADSFGPLLAEPNLAGRYRLITYRRRGYGSGKPVLETTPITAEQQAADCAALLRSLGIERTHVVGHSFGGCIALQLALDAPDLVSTLALLESALFVGQSAEAYRESLLRSRDRYRAEGPTFVMEEFLRARMAGLQSRSARAGGPRRVRAGAAETRQASWCPARRTSCNWRVRKFRPFSPTRWRPFGL